jgi:hypothetical protein
VKHQVFAWNTVLELSYGNDNRAAKNPPSRTERMQFLWISA